ncbi:hypothetical protein HRbin36_00019 [bacterium HR36]|nr:hypothetical protein HRbin36_00019 [bacterium HR36]
MWETFFGLRERVFTPVADAALPLLPTQQTARQELLERLADGHHIVVLVGEGGVGKTRLLLDLAHELVPQRTVIWMPPGVPQDVADLYQSLLFDLGLSWSVPEGSNPTTWANTWRLRFGEWLLQQAKAQSSVLIIAEDVHRWPELVLQEWREIAQFLPNSTRLLQIVLSARPSLLERLASAPLSEWADSIGYCVWLEPLSPEQARQHLQAILSRVGASLPQLLDPRAVELLVRHTRGIPRLLHQAMLRALHLAYSDESRHLEAPFIVAALAELGLLETTADDTSTLTDASAA